jgi:hypothetical protein
MFFDLLIALVYLFLHTLVLFYHGVILGLGLGVRARG